MLKSKGGVPSEGSFEGWFRQSGVAVSASAMAAVVGLGASAFIGSATPTARAAEGCPNEAQRVEQASALPECRAYEMVTPPLKGSGEPEPIELSEAREEHDIQPLQVSHLQPANGARAGTERNRLAWLSEPLPGAAAPGVSHLSTRSADGWVSKDLVPPVSLFNDLLCPLQLGVSGWSSDLTRSILDLPAGAPRGFHEERECGSDEPRLVTGEPEHFRNLFVHNNLNGSNLLVNVTPSNIVWPEPEESNQTYWPASFLAGSDDLSHVVFEEELALTPDAPIGYRGGDELYEWANGEVRLVTVLPGGTPVHGSLAGATRNYAAEFEHVVNQAFNVAQFRHAVSADGSRIFFEAEGGLYLREDSTQTIQVDESQGPGPDGGGRFMIASADGSRIFFTDESKLTADSTASSSEPDLYEYDVESDQLIDVTVDSSEPADVLGVSGASEDGSYLYFVARGALTEEPNSEDDTAIADHPNLYLIHDGVTRFVATLDPTSDECDWTMNANCNGGVLGSGLTARISSTGAFLGFNSVRSLTGYDNIDTNAGEPDIEIFLYDAAADELSCASCNPSGSQPAAGAAIHWPSPPGRNNNWDNAYTQRNVSDRGQVFFETADALLPRDGNGRRDVYEYVDGQIHLLSTGTDEASSHFLDATPDGSDVFFSTAQRLLPRDMDEAYDYYDARIEGGFVEPSSPSPSCDGGSCHGGGSAETITDSPGTNTFAGSGNVHPHRRCRVFTSRARELNRQAQRLRSRSQQRAEQLAKRARDFALRAKHCRRTKGRAAS
jgi:hypothetical protein